MSMPIDYRARIRQSLINGHMGEYGADDLLEGLIRQVRDGYPAEAAVHQQLADAQATIARVQAKVADWREWNPKEMSWAIRDVENAIANTPPPEPQDPATLDGPSATDDALARQRADGHAARLEAMDRTEHADLNRHHLRPTGDGGTA